jgi:hypothetical protein
VLGQKSDDLVAYVVPRRARLEKIAVKVHVRVEKLNHRITGDGVEVEDVTARVVDEP